MDVTVTITGWLPVDPKQISLSGEPAGAVIWTADYHTNGIQVMVDLSAPVGVICRGRFDATMEMLYRPVSISDLRMWIVHALREIDKATD